jgi:hypothetical protein
MNQTWRSVLRVALAIERTGSIFLIRFANDVEGVQASQAISTIFFTTNDCEAGNEARYTNK